MTIVISDPGIIAAVTAAGDHVEVRTPDGTLLAVLRSPDAIQYPEFDVTYAELDRRRKLPSSECVSGEQVMARLRELRDAA